MSSARIPLPCFAAGLAMLLAAASASATADSATTDMQIPGGQSLADVIQPGASLAPASEEPPPTPPPPSSPPPPRLLFKTGFEGETAVVPGAPAEHLLVGRDTTLPDAPSDWLADFQNRLGFGPPRIEYTGGEDHQRIAKIVPDPADPQNHVLWFWLHDGWKADGGAMKSRIQVDFYGRETGLTELYQSVRVFLPADWNALKTYPGKIGWLTIAEFWNDAYWQPAHNPKGFRITPGITKLTDGEVDALYFSLNAENPRQREVWRARNSTVQVPIARWFTLEYYFREGGPDDGRFYMAVTPDGEARQVVFDIVGWTRNTTDPTPGGITDWNPMKLYTSPSVVRHPVGLGQTLQIYWDDFALWTDRVPIDSTPSRPEVRPGF